jgi:hypothetical protein
VTGQLRYWIYAGIGELLATAFFVISSNVSISIALVYATLTVAGTAILGALVLRRWKVAGYLVLAMLLVFGVLVAINQLR